ncbi:MAG: NAD-dependent epimerase/dehydratase [uncultured bacterium]|nr:MAG: NAD-dependent epimerase/dehydratase [uncultured bacterium]
MNNEIKNILITGGAGYLGSTLSAYLLGLGYNVSVADSHWFNKIENGFCIKNPKFKEYYIDLRDTNKLCQLLKNCDAVIHLSGVVGDSACALDENFTFGCNYLNTFTVANLAKSYGVKIFLFASSCSVYGSMAGSSALTENSPTNPLSYYANDKLKSEECVLSLKNESFSPVVFRLSTLFGWSDRMRFDLVVNGLTARAAINEPIKIFGGTQWRPFLHVKDASIAFELGLHSNKKIAGQIFNVGSDKNNFTINQISELIQYELPNTFVLQCENFSDLRDYKVEFSKIESWLGFNTSVTVSDGIKEIINNMRKYKIKDLNRKTFNNEATTKLIIQQHNVQKLLEKKAGCFENIR